MLPELTSEIKEALAPFAGLVGGLGALTDQAFKSQFADPR